MQEMLKQIKQEYIAKLQAKKAECEAKIEIVANQKFAQKKAMIDADNEQLDKALADYIQTKQEQLNREIAEKRQEVADKKANSEIRAKADAEAEARAEIANLVNELDNEIAAQTQSIS